MLLIVLNGRFGWTTSILAIAKERQKRQQSKLNATPEGAADTSEDADKAQVASKASSTGKSE